jgi:crotonobetainyl-CoA:carnitine CoA-transferase CaiB-like acyl-CoA transferase
MAQAPLHGLRVVDLSSTFMGPYCTMLLGQWGADVLKVEPPSGDVVRYIGDHRETGMGPIFLGTNRGKRSLVLDLKRAESADVLTRLVETCDIFVHNMRPSAARRLGISGEQVLAVNPRAVYLAFRGFGAGGPYQGLHAYDDIIQAASGITDLQGGDEPQYVGSSLADKTVGLMGAAAVLAALRGRDVSGVGQIVEIPMFETMVGFNLLEQQGGKMFVPPAGPSGYARTRSIYRKPYRTKDGAVAVMIYTDAQWKEFFEQIGRTDLLDEEKYRTIRERTIHSDELYRMVEQAMLTRTTDEWLDRLAVGGIATSRVNSIDDLFDDPHLTATGFFRTVTHPSEGELLLPRVPGLVNDDERNSYAPLLGQHTREVLVELGFDGPALERLLGVPADPIHANVEI